MIRTRQSDPRVSGPGGAAELLGVNPRTLSRLKASGLGHGTKAESSGICHSIFQILEYRMSQGLLSQDVVVLAKLVSYGGGRPSIAQVAGDLALSPSQVHASLKRLERSRLIDAQTGRPLLKAVEEFLIHGVKYAFPVQRGEATRGMPTAYAAPPLSDQIAESGDLPPVWPDAGRRGTRRDARATAQGRAESRPEGSCAPRACWR